MYVVLEERFDTARMLPHVDPFHPVPFSLHTSQSPSLIPAPYSLLRPSSRAARAPGSRTAGRGTALCAVLEYT